MALVNGKSGSMKETKGELKRPREDTCKIQMSPCPPLLILDACAGRLFGGVLSTYRNQSHVGRGDLN